MIYFCLFSEAGKNKAEPQAPCREKRRHRSKSGTKGIQHLKAIYPEPILTKLKCSTAEIFHCELLLTQISSGPRGGGGGVDSGQVVSSGAYDPIGDGMAQFLKKALRIEVLAAII